MQLGMIVVSYRLIYTMINAIVKKWWTTQCQISTSKAQNLLVGKILRGQSNPIGIKD